MEQSSRSHQQQKSRRHVREVYKILKTEHMKARLLKHHGLLWVTATLADHIARSFEYRPKRPLRCVGADMESIEAAQRYLMCTPQWAKVNEVLQSTYT